MAQIHLVPRGVDRIDGAAAVGVVVAGMRVNFTIEQGQGGMYEVRSLAPMGSAR